jgi:xanthine dehydrogenase iron-sulfur cluster and FAD-binding subunit A
MEPIRLQAIEKQLEGQAVAHPTVWAQSIAPILQAGMADFRPPSDFRASSGYRQVSGRNLAYRILEEATNVCRWRGMASSQGSM